MEFINTINGQKMRVVDYPVEYPYQEDVLDKDDFGVFCESEDGKYSNVYTRRYLERTYQVALTLL